jgi:glycine reductase complex component B subunit gamma
VTAIPTIAAAVGANRVTVGKAVSYPFGDPSLDFGQELAYRRALIETALRALRVEVKEPTLFEMEDR